MEFLPCCHVKTRVTFHEGVTTANLEVEGNGYESGFPELVAVVDSDAGTCRHRHLCSHNPAVRSPLLQLSTASIYCKPFCKFKLCANIGSHATGFDVMPGYAMRSL